MYKQKLIDFGVNVLLTAFGAALGYLSLHAGEVDAKWGPLVGALSLGLLNIINGWLAKTSSVTGKLVSPAEKIVSLAVKKDK